MIVSVWMVFLLTFLAYTLDFLDFNHSRRSAISFGSALKGFFYKTSEEDYSAFITFPSCLSDNLEEIEDGQHENAISLIINTRNSETRRVDRVCFRPEYFSSRIWFPVTYDVVLLMLTDSMYLTWHQDINLEDQYPRHTCIQLFGIKQIKFDLLNLNFGREKHDLKWNRTPVVHDDRSRVLSRKCFTTCDTTNLSYLCYRSKPGIVAQIAVKAKSSDVSLYRRTYEDFEDYLNFVLYFTSKYHRDFYQYLKEAEVQNKTLTLVVLLCVMSLLVFSLIVIGNRW